MVPKMKQPVRKQTRPEDDVVLRIRRVLDHPNLVDRDDYAALDAIHRQLLYWPEHEDANSVQVLHTMADERLRRVNESSIKD